MAAIHADVMNRAESKEELKNCAVLKAGSGIVLSNAIPAIFGPEPRR
jgi:hypothetical protein